MSLQGNSGEEIVSIHCSAFSGMEVVITDEDGIQEQAVMGRGVMVPEIFMPGLMPEDCPLKKEPKGRELEDFARVCGGCTLATIKSLGVSESEG